MKENLPNFSQFKSEYLVPFDGSFRRKDSETNPADKPSRELPKKKKLKEDLEDLKDELYDLQRMLYADDRWSVLCIFQAIDAAGKDSTIRAVMTGINPAGCHVTSFKQPSHNELDHDFLWRSNRALPARGTIGVFNRSYYEEVLIVRVHPEILAHQKLPMRPAKLSELWEERYRSIRELEEHLARNGTIVLKFWLNVSKEEQRKRFLSRLNEPEKNWKFSESDVKEREHWDHYVEAYESALNATSRPCAPWFAIPADNKPYMRREVARILVETLSSLGLEYPKVSDEQRSRFEKMRESLTSG